MFVSCIGNNLFFFFLFLKISWKSFFCMKLGYICVCVLVRVGVGACVSSYRFQIWMFWMINWLQLNSNAVGPCKCKGNNSYFIYQLKKKSIDKIGLETPCLDPWSFLALSLLAILVSVNKEKKIKGKKKKERNGEILLIFLNSGAIVVRLGVDL